MDAPTKAQAHAGLLEWLRRQGIEHELHEHELTYTATSTARAEGVDDRTFAKVVGVAAHDGRKALFVLDAPDRVDLAKARGVLGTDEVRLLTEAELAELAPECEAGAIPAVGVMFGVPLYADHAVAEDPEISFNAGSHRVSVRVDRAEWERAAGVQYADLAQDDDLRPAWAR